MGAGVKQQHQELQYHQSPRGRTFLFLPILIVNVSLYVLLLMLKEISRWTCSVAGLHVPKKRFFLAVLFELFFFFFFC